MEEKLKKELKYSVIIDTIVVSFFLIAGVWTLIYALVVLCREEFDGVEFFWMIATSVACTGYFLYGVVTNISLYKDYKLYKNTELEKMRAVVLSKKKVCRTKGLSYFKIKIQDVETNKELDLNVSKNDIKLGEVYDFLYTKYSMHFAYEPVPQEELLQQRREKAEKIEFDTKHFKFTSDEN